MPERSLFNDVPSLTQLTALRLARYRLSDPKGYEAAERRLSDAAKVQVEALYPWVRVQTQSWFERHEKFLPMHARPEAYLNALQWSSSGVDAQATAKVLLQDSRLRASHRYSLACLHGLEPETIQALLREARTENLRYWVNLDLIRREEEDLLTFWAYQCGGQLPKLITQWACRVLDLEEYVQQTEACHGMDCAVTALSLGAVRYFYPLITAAEREQHQERWALFAARGSRSSKGCPEVLVFFLERMTAEERRALINRQSDVLEYLVDWPYRRVFFGLYEEVVQELSPDKIADLLYYAVLQGGDFFLTLWQHPATVSRRVLLPNCSYYSYIVRRLLKGARFSELAMVLEAMTIESYRDWLDHRKGMNTYLGLVDHVAGKGAAAIEPLLEQLIRRGLPERTLTHLQALLTRYESMIGGDPSRWERKQLVQLRPLLENTLLRLTASRPDPEVASTASSQASSQASQRKEDVAADPIEEPPIKLMKRQQSFLSKNRTTTMPERSLFNDVPSLTQLTALRLARYRLSNPKGCKPANVELSEAGEAEVQKWTIWVQTQAQSWFEQDQRFLPKGTRLEDYLEYLHWTPSGFLNTQLTVSSLLQDNRLDAGNRYRLACIHGLESEKIQALFTEAQKTNPDYWNDPENIWEDDDRILAFWTYKLHNRLPEVIDDGSLNVSIDPAGQAQWTEACHGMGCAVNALSLGAIRYFYPLLTAEERGKYQARWALSAARGRLGSKGCPEVLVFFLEQMTVVERQALIHKQLAVLEYLMDWPYRRVFFRLYEEVAQDLSLDNMGNLLFRAVLQKDNFFLTLWQHPATVSRRVLLPNCSYYSYIVSELLKETRFSELAMVLEAMTIESYRDWLDDRKGMATYLGLVDYGAGGGIAAIEPLLEQLIRRGLPERTLTHLQALLTRYESMIGGDPSWWQRKQLVQLRSFLENTLLRLTASRPDPEVASTASSAASSQASQRKEDVAADPIEEPPIKLMKRQQSFLSKNRTTTMPERSLFNDVPSLTQLTALRLARYRLSNPKGYEAAERRLSKRGLSNAAKAQVEALYPWVQAQTQSWFERHENFLPMHARLEAYLNALQWSSSGIDAQATAKVLLQDSRLRASHRYGLACLHGLEPKTIQALLIEAQTEDARYWGDLSRIRCGEEDLVTFWTYKCSGQLPELIAQWARRTADPAEYTQRTEARHGMECAVTALSLGAIRYFYPLITAAERKRHQTRWVSVTARGRLGSRGCPEVVVFFLERMTAEERRALIEYDIEGSFIKEFDILQCLMNWPYRGLFFDLYEEVVQELLPEDINCLLFYAVVRGGDFFLTLWQHPATVSRRVVLPNCSCYSYIVSRLLEEARFSELAMVLEAMTIERYRAWRDHREGMVSLGAVRYFYPLITAAEREQHQARWALFAARGSRSSKGCPEVLVFFLERMTAEKRRALINRRPDIFDWPYRGLFFGLYEEVVQELLPEDIACLLYQAVLQGGDCFLTLWQHPATVSRRVVLPHCSYYSYIVSRLLKEARFSELAMVLEAMTIERYRAWLDHREGMDTYLGLVDHVAGKGAAAIEPLLEQLIRRGLPERTLTHLQALLAHYESMIGRDQREQLVQLRSFLENTLLRLTASRPDPEVASTASSQASQRKEDVAADPIEEPPIKLMKR